MPLKFPDEWKFEGVGISIRPEAGHEFFNLVTKMATGVVRRQSIFETFKSAFGSQSYSSDAGWAETDLASAMSGSWDNAAEFLASFWQGMEDVKKEGVAVPSHTVLNKILDKWEIPLVIDPPDLRRKEGDITLSSVVEPGPTSSSSVYVRGEEVGHGGFGIVYRVTRTTQAGTFDFAMKVYDPSSFIKDK